MKKILTTIIVTIIFVLNTMVIYANEPYTIFIRTGCQYCAKVEAFIQKYALEDKVNLRQTYNNEENSQAFVDAGKKYNVPDNQLGVPFMIVDEDTYLMGDKPIIDFFAQKYDLDISDLNNYNTSVSDMIFLGIGGLALVSILGYGIYSSFKKN